ncbi:hypothetical protein [Pseudoalteromonas sp.]|nr:hypothetical protein [Pseudoalteromonas sp.]
MSTQAEQTLENNLIAQLKNLGFEDNKKIRQLNTFAEDFLKQCPL